MRLFLLMVSVMVLALPLAGFAQCDCDFVISNSSSEWMFDGAAKGVKPGDKICFTSGTRTPIALYNIKGTAANPVIISNMCDGKVTISGSTGNPYAVEIHKSSYFRFTGSGNASQQYGIEIKGTVMGIDVRDLSTDFEVDHLRITNLDYAGIVAKTDPTCESSTWRGKFTMRNTSFHDNYIADVKGEALYIGNSHYHTTVAKSCNGSTIQVQEHEVIGVKVYNNIIKNTGNDGIQIGGVTSGCYIYNNDIYNVGTNNGYGQQSGIQINPGTNAECYNNKIDKGTGYGIFAGGRGASHVYNNIIMNHGQGGIICQDYAPVDTRGFIFANNTLINNKDMGIYMFSQNTSQNLFINNIIVAYNQSNYQYVKLNNPNGIKWTESNNIKTADLASLKFVNAGSKDYRLTSASALALNLGKDAKANGVTTDFDGTARPQGGAFDIGAFELKSGGTANKAPVANAGADKTTTLPTNSVSLAGKGTDSDGTIASYAWTKVSGGAATLTNASSATVTVSKLVAGTYTFRLTVKDNAGATGTDDVVVTVKAATAANKAPIANAGADKTITLPTNSVSIAGKGTDSDGTIASYTWTKVSGGTATLTNASSATVTVSKLVAGTYTFRLTVKDNAGATGTDNVVVTVKAATSANKPPSVNAGSNKAITLPRNSIVFSGAASGTIVSYTWTKVSGGTATLSNANTAKVTASKLVAGKYTFRLTAKDNTGATGYDDVVITVNAAPAISVGTAARFSFTSTAQNVSGWTELVGSPHAAVISKKDPTTGITVSSVSTAQWNPANYGSPTSSFNGGVTNGTVQPAAVVIGNWFNYNAAYGTTVNGVVQKDNIMVSGLNPSHKYKLQMGASRASGAGTTDQYGTFEYRINGANVKTLLVTNNASQQVEYTNLTPNGSGQIGISARKQSGSAMNFGYMGWLVITDLTTGTTNAREIAALDYEADTVVTEDVATNTFDGEGSFSFNDKVYPGTGYALIVYNSSGQQIFAGEWTDELYQSVFRPGELYIYHVIQGNRKVDVGKIFVTMR